MLKDVFVVKVPQLGTNDQVAILVEWHISEEEKVSVGDILCTLETSKAIFDVEAEVAGHVLCLVEFMSEIGNSRPLALIGSNLDALRAEKDRYMAEVKAASGVPGEAVGAIRATQKAKNLARELDVDLAEIDATGIIREEDVKRFAARTDHDVAHGAETGKQEWITPPSSDESGFIEPQFLTHIEKDPGFAQLSSDLKIYLYRSHGAQIGENVKIGGGSIILSQVILLSDNVEIGSECYIKTDRFVLGKMSVIGNRARVATREVVIGEMFFSGENVVIGGGGAFGPRSSLQVGNNCLVSSNCVLNTGEPITLGDEVGLSPNVQLYTHSHWQNVLQGYSALHAPIIVESGAYITGNCIVVPGVRIGNGATVLANSVVTATVAPFTVVSGVPAKAHSSVNTNLTVSRKNSIIRRLMVEMADILRFHEFDPDTVLYIPTYDCRKSTKADVVLAFDVTNLPDSLERPVVFDLSSFCVYGVQTRLSDEVRNFLRRRGIRFKPIYWRYTHDKGFVQ